MNLSISDLLNSLWKERKIEKIKNIEDIGSRTKPTEIFGIFRPSNKRRFSDKKALVIGIRPLECWGDNDKEPLTWLEKKGGDELGVLFELEDKSRVIGILTRREYKNIYNENIGLGNYYYISGVFELIKIIEEIEVCMFFRIVKMELIN